MYKNISIQDIIAKNKKANITSEIREAQMISFIKGNSFDVFPKENRLTKEFVKHTITEHKPL